MNTEAIFSDGTGLFRIPAEPKENSSVLIKIRFAKDDEVEVSLFNDTASLQMTKVESDELFDYYGVSVQLTDREFFYLFEIRTSDGAKYYYDRAGLTDYVRYEYGFSIVPGFSTPEWSKGAVMYQILVDRFYNGDPSNDVETNEYYYIKTYSTKVNDWDKPPANFGVAEFYGGDLEGVRQKLYYLKSLGVEVIYFNPLFVSPSNHKYDAADYDYIDPHYGKIIVDDGEVLCDGDTVNAHATKFKTRVTDLANLKSSNAFFAQFVDEAHAAGIKVILDGVFNHCGSFNKWLDRERIYDAKFGYPEGAYQSKESPYHSYFKFIETEDDKWPNNGSYEGWWGHDTLPKLNYEGSKELYDYIINIARKWVSPPYNVDGWRLDVAADLGHSPETNHQFWKDFRDAVKEANPNAIILAEHYGDASSWMDGKQWDTLMNYDAFMEPLTYFLTGMEKHSDSFEQSAIGDGERFKNTMLHYMTRMKTSSLHCAMNQLSNHDHSRFLTRTNHKTGRVEQLGSAAAGENVNIPVMKEAVIVQMTWPGAPTLYYGDEAGVVGFTDPDNRRTYPWGNANYELIDFHRDAIMMHKTSKALRKGSFIFLECGRNYISYGRFIDGEKVAVVVNSSPDDIDVKMSVWKLGVPKTAKMSQMLVTNPRGHSMMPIEREVVDGVLAMTVSGYSAYVLKYE